MNITDQTQQQNPLNFPLPNPIAKKSPSSKLTSILIRNINEYKLNYTQLKTIFQMARKRCDIKPPKASNKLYELPTSLQIKNFYNQISNPIHQLIFETLHTTGVRISELTSLTINNIDFNSNTIYIKQGKGSKDRITLMSDNLKNKLIIYLHNRNNHYLFESNLHRKFTTRRIQQLCKHYATLSQTKITCHTFRHLWNTTLAMANIPREKREILAGHAHGSKTQDIYTHLSVGGFKDEIVKVLSEMI